MTLSFTISSGAPLATVAGSPILNHGAYLVALTLSVIAIGLILAARRIKKQFNFPVPEES